MNLRIKNYLRIQKIKSQLHFLLNPYNGIRIVHNDLLELILNKIVALGEKERIIQELHSELNINKKILTILIDRMVKLHILEYFEPNDEDRKYARYDRQLNFFDLTLQVTNREELFTYQERLSNAHVVILGVGGIGNYGAIALAGAGVGELTLFDGDIIEYSNLNRQILFDEDNVGEVKIDVAENRLKRFNKKTKINKVQLFCETESDLKKALASLGKIDMILLSADKPRKLVSWVDSFCTENRVPFIPCGYFGNYGIVGPLIGPETEAYSQKYPEINKEIEDVLIRNQTYSPPSMASTNGIVSNLAVLEIIKYLTGFDIPRTLSKRLLLNFSDYSVTIE